MKKRLAVISAVLTLILPAYAQKREEKPKVHTDFQFGSYPTSREAAEMILKAQGKWEAILAKIG